MTKSGKRHQQAVRAESKIAQEITEERKAFLAFEEVERRKRLAAIGVTVK